jgi:hypothetical protein
LDIIVATIKLDIKNSTAVATNLRKQVEKLELGVSRAKVTFTKQALKAIVELLPVWSGKTQDSIRVSERSRPSPTKKNWDWKEEYGHTNEMPLGRGVENMANPGKIMGQSRNVRSTRLNPRTGHVYIVGASPATDAGLFEGRTPNVRGTKLRPRNPTNMMRLILQRAINGTPFEIKSE